MPHPLAAALARPEAARALAEVAVDFLLDQPLNRLVRADAMLPVLDRLLDERLTERAAQVHMRPFIDREIARGKTRGDTVGDWLTAEAKAELRSLVGRPVRIERRTVEKIVKQPQVKELIRQVVRDTLERFVETIKTGGDDAGAVGSLGRRAFGFANRATAGVLGSIGGAVEAKLTTALNAFVANNLDGVLDKVVAVATSPDTAQKISKGAVHVFDEAMALPGEKVARQAEKLAEKRIWDDLLEPLPGLLAHNLGREAIRQGIREEVATALAVEGERPLRAFWADEAAVAAARADAVEVLAPLFVDFASHSGYLAWLATHIPQE